MNANDKNLISVFDFSVTKKELYQLGIFFRSKDEYLRNTSLPTIFVDLASLFRLRNNLERFNFFIKISQEVEALEIYSN